MPLQPVMLAADGQFQASLRDHQILGGSGGVAVSFVHRARTQTGQAMPRPQAPQVAAGNERYDLVVGWFAIAGHGQGPVPSLMPPLRRMARADKVAVTSSAAAGRPRR